MADKSSIIIGYTDHSSGKAQQKTITDINPQASSAKLATWGEMTAALTKDNYAKTTRIDKTECDTVTTLTPELHYACKNESGEYVSPTIPSSGNINILTSRIYAQTLTITIGNVGNITMPHVLNITDSETANPVQMTETKLSSSGWWTIAFQTSPKGDITARTVKFTLHFDATAQYDAYDKDITINVTEPEEEQNP